MIKQCGHYVTFQEVPNEIALTFTITNCPHHCQGCHSPWLQEDIGDALYIEDIKYYLSQYDGAVTAVCFMGEGSDPETLAQLLKETKQTGYKVCLYVEEEFIDDIPVFKYLAKEDWPHYLKTGAYVENNGPLNSETTNQRMLKLTPDNDFYIDITNWFWKKKI